MFPDDLTDVAKLWSIICLSHTANEKGYVILFKVGRAFDLWLFLLVLSPTTWLVLYIIMTS